jgi:hypothetical protein
VPEPPAITIACSMGRFSQEPQILGQPAGCSRICKNALLGVTATF